MKVPINCYDEQYYEELPVEISIFRQRVGKAYDALIAWCDNHLEHSHNNKEEKGKVMM